MTGSSTSAHRCCISEGVLSRRERRTLSPQWGVGTCLTAGLGSDPKPNKKALRVALTRCGTLSQNGYGTHMESLRHGSITEPPAGQKRASRAAQVRDPIQDSGSPEVRSWASQAMQSGNYYDPYPEVLVIAP